MVRDLFKQCGELALHGVSHDGVSAEGSTLIREGAERFLTALEEAEALTPAACVLPLVNQVGTAATAIGQELATVANELPWSISPRKHDLEGNNTGLVVMNDLFNLGGVAAGLVAMLPGAHYPEHSHPPQELYVMLDGTASWRYGGSQTYVEVGPGGTIYNHPSDWHGIRANDDVVLAMYILWGDGL